MLSPETPSYSVTDVDPKIVALVRRDFKWRPTDKIEIPIALVLEPSADGADEFPIEHWIAMGNIGALSGCLSWYSSPYPHAHIHVDYVFFIRPLRRKVLSYNDAECEFVWHEDCQVDLSFLSHPPKGLSRIIASAVHFS